MAKSLFTGKLSNGVSIEVLEAESFSGKTEFAVKVGNEVACVSSVNVLRNDDIQVKTSAKSIRVKANDQNPSSTKAPTLSDVDKK